MDSIILKATKGNRTSMNQLYESNKKHVYYVANALLRGSPSAIEGMEIVDKVCETAEPTDSNGSITRDEQPIITSITIRTEATE